MSDIDPWFLENLICPVDGGALVWDAPSSSLTSTAGRTYPVVDGVPVMLPEEVTPTLAAVHASRQRAERGAPWYLDSVLVNEDQKQGILRMVEEGSAIDPVAAHLVAATNGLGYIHLVGKLTEYPIPEIRLPPGQGRSFLDIGCSWGRWCMAAARHGYQPVGLDPSLGAVMAARRICAQLGVKARFIVGDARHLPLGNNLFDQVFSYSVIQHFSPADAARTIDHAGRVLRAGGRSLIQMPTRWGLRCLYNQVRRGFREPAGFEVRYWALEDLRRVFESKIGSTRFSVDCFFGIGWQRSDAHLMPVSYRLIIAVSELLRRTSKSLPWLTWVADSVYVDSIKNIDCTVAKCSVT